MPTAAAHSIATLLPCRHRTTPASSQARTRIYMPANGNSCLEINVTLIVCRSSPLSGHPRSGRFPGLRNALPNFLRALTTAPSPFPLMPDSRAV
ncbi:hypothetical protein E2C01_041632 [Portunus trituberculatus]|uniref:Uncharacterized protein n=1 Tax=Portunus trituberculatus TaxID=210409 RepID=A0A5B7FN32_PORTR|nr:hypothetical protein [Portunus trituberculatus]